MKPRHSITLIEICKTIDPGIHVAAVEIGKAERRPEYGVEAIPIRNLVRSDCDDGRVHAGKHTDRTAERDIRFRTLVEPSMKQSAAPMCRALFSQVAPAF